MYKTVSHYLSKALVENNIIKVGDYEIYQFGLELWCSYVVNFVFTLALGLILGMTLESFVFLLSFIPLRSNAGGYHSDSQGRCFALSVITTFALFIIVKCAMIHVSLWLCMLILLLDCVFILRIGTVENHNKPLDLEEVQSYNRRARVILLIEIISLSALWLLNQPLLSLTIIATITLVAISVLLGWICNRKNMK